MFPGEQIIGRQQTSVDTGPYMRTHSQLISTGFDSGGKKVGSAVLCNHSLVLERFLKVLELQGKTAVIKQAIRANSMLWRLRPLLGVRGFLALALTCQLKRTLLGIKMAWIFFFPVFLFGTEAIPAAFYLATPASVKR